ncbi:MAG: DEAD/DEAH box helicase [Halobacteriota archaeon]|nr:DEAD/DEAH box helicase [Halobacteriota archaeon]
MAEFIAHPMIKPAKIQKRSYQISLAEKAAKKSTMIVLPTGMGKTVIALLVMAERLDKGKILMLSPTKPLVEQHVAFLRSALRLDPEDIQVFTGEITPDKREALWKNARVIVSTPQVIENDLLNRKIDFRDVAHITFDECHRAVGNYAYVYLAEKYSEQSENPLTLGITASPGSESDKISEICSNLHIESVEIRTEYDSDVSPYVHEKKIEWRVVELPEEIRSLKRMMSEILVDRLDRLHRLGFLPYKRRDISMRELLALQKRTQILLSQQKHSNTYKAASIEAEILKLKHALDLIETQGVSALQKYFERLENEAKSKDGSKATKRLLSEPNIKKAISLLDSCKEHPKLNVARRIITGQFKNSPNSRIIVFANFRDTAEMITSSLRDLDAVRPIKFIGQASKYEDKGLSQKKQVEILDKFRKGEYNVMVATSVAEEGLDIPSTDLVLFYEPVPSEIRNIQRKGRTGRGRFGRVIVLIAKNTKDEAYYWASKGKEEKMYRKMRQLQRSADYDTKSFEKPSFQKMLGDNDCQVKVFADQREARSAVVKSLDKLGVELVLKTLEVGDYVLSERVCVERKRVEDLLSSFMDKRYLFGQLSDMSNEYEKPLLIIEGDGLYETRNIHPNAIRGLLGTLAIDFCMPVIFTKDEEDTAAMLQVIARREQEKKPKNFNPHGKRSSLSLKEQQEYLVSSISNIGPVTARNLLTRFGSVENVIKASKERLMEVERVGPITADKIREVVGSDYGG